MTRTVTMTRDQLDRRIFKAIEIAMNPSKGRQAPRFKPVKDPITGCMEMVPVEIRTWGELGTSPAVVSAIGQLLYDRCMSDCEDGSNFAIIGLVQSAEFLYGHADEEQLGRFARDFVMVARGHADNSIVEDCSLVLDFHTSDTGFRMAFAAQMTCESVTFSLFDRSNGVHVNPPVVFYYDEDGELGKEEAEFTLTLEELRDEDDATRRMLTKMRREARPAPVFSMEEFRARRAV